MTVAAHVSRTPSAAKELPLGEVDTQPDIGAQLSELLDKACRRIAPAWPLDRLAAVNPLWGFIDASVEDVSAQLSGLAGTKLTMPHAWYRSQYEAGQFDKAHLQRAIENASLRATPEDILNALKRGAAPPNRRALVADVADQQNQGDSEIRNFIVDSLSRFCAAHFQDASFHTKPHAKHEGHACNHKSHASTNLYSSWRAHALRDRRPQLAGIPSFYGQADELPEDARHLITLAMIELDIAPAQQQSYLTALLFDIHGWASWCAYLRWTAELDGRSDDHIVDLLAMRLAWERLLFRQGDRALASRWQMAMAGWPSHERTAAAEQKTAWVAQRALEIAFQERIARALPTQHTSPIDPAAGGLDMDQARHTPDVQAAFCIDVRSEVYRRALETASREKTHERVQTLGFAGFFGLPIEYLPAAGHAARPQLPGLLAPRLRATDTAIDDVVDARASRLSFQRAWKAFKGNATSMFSFVESIGLLYAGKLIGDSLGSTRPVASPERAGLLGSEHARRKPRLTATAGGGELDLEQRCSAAEGILRAMSLTKNFARLVALVGHGSETVNNPQAAGLDCGACCGHSGEVNARAVAALLNETQVRKGLAERGIVIPQATVFIAGLHNTTTDDVALFDLDEVPATHQSEVSAFRQWLAQASSRAREERAESLGLESLSGEKLHNTIRRRAKDWSQVRPEWGLAGNAAFIVGPRERIKHLNLEGRSFLHDYRAEDDPGFSILELIMTAPMVVTHWINFQYYTSTVDNRRFGSGNKVLHDVVGGHIGVFEGNGGDLRIGLPIQSLHNGTEWMHPPIRLNVYIDAPRDAIEQIVTRHPTVQNLVENEWLYLFHLGDPSRGEPAVSQIQTRAKQSATQTVIA